MFIGGGALAFWATSRRGTLVKALPTGSNAIPEDAVLVLALSSDEAQWRRLRQFGTPDSQAQFDQLLAQGQKRLLSDQNINFATDIQPWVGPEVTLAVLPTPTGTAIPGDPEPIPDPETALTSNLVIVVPIADALKAQTGLGKRLDEAAPLEEEPYRGVTVQQINREGETPLFAAVLNREMAILSPQLPLLRRSIDAYKGGKSLVNRPGFSRAFEQIEDNQPLARWYMDVPAAVQTIANTAEPALPANSLEALQVPRGIAGVAMVKSRGLHLQAISWLDPGSQVFATGNPASQMPQRLPAETLLMASGGTFSSFGKTFRAVDSFRPSCLSPDDISLTLQSATG
ncbi:MAG: DUF3352 domain-containing protein, partial [Leptolyngbyaceae cyanobacterium SM2_3_12]|nr:DUF3352 domain-containing protein [Leptolyngbyaceae cyanobacterium SM2_3_12]